MNHSERFSQIFTQSHPFAFGFDDLFKSLEASSQNPSYPPHDIEHVHSEDGEDKFIITMAVAGFKQDEISIESKDNKLIITGNKSTKDSSTKNYLFKQIAERDFKKSFVLGQYVEVNSASLEDGLLIIDLIKKIPDHAKPKLIPIGTNNHKAISTKK